MHVILIDGRNACFRFGWAYKGLSYEGHPTSVLYGLVFCLIRLKNKYPNSMFVVVWDEKTPDGKTWRHSVMPTYKGNRLKATYTREQNRLKSDIEKQVDPIKELCSLLGIPSIGIPGIEADDLIGIIAFHLKQYGLTPVVYSSDKDFMQLIRFGVTVIRDVNKKDKLVAENDKSILEKFGCAAKDILKVRAICGDSSDGIKGAVRGLGEKTAAKLVCSGGVDPSKKDTPFAEKRPEWLLGRPSSKDNKLWDLWQAWKTVRLNYKVMKIVTSPESKVFDATTRKAIDKMLGSLCVDLALTSGVMGGITSKGYRAILSFLSRYGLNDAIEKRVVLTNLQSRKT